MTGGRAAGMLDTDIGDFSFTFVAERFAISIHYRSPSAFLQCGSKIVVAQEVTAFGGFAHYST